MEKEAAAAKKKKRVYRKNTVKGTRPGGRYPEEVKTAALADMLVCRNLSEVARRYGVPESTLRTWRKKLSAGGEKDVFDKARLAALQEINFRAARGAALSVDYLEKRLIHAAETEKLREEMLEEQDLTKKEKMVKQLHLRRGMDDGDAANAAGKLMGILAKSQEMLQGESAEDENGDDLSVSIEVVRE